MSQDELAIRVIIDPTQFREELGRLRRDLEDQHRIDMDEFRKGRREEEYRPDPTVVEIRESVVGRADEDRIKQYVDEQIDLMRRERGLLPEESRVTPDMLIELFGAAINRYQSGEKWAWVQGEEDVLKPQAQEIFDMIVDLKERYGGETGLEAIRAASISDSVAMRETMGLIEELRQNLVEKERFGRPGMIQTRARRALTAYARGVEGAGGEGLMHKALKSFLVEMSRIVKGGRVEAGTEVGVDTGGRLDAAMFTEATEYFGEVKTGDAGADARRQMREYIESAVIRRFMKEEWKGDMPEPDTPERDRFFSEAIKWAKRVGPERIAARERGEDIPKSIKGLLMAPYVTGNLATQLMEDLRVRSRLAAPFMGGYGEEETWGLGVTIAEIPEEATAYVRAGMSALGRAGETPNEDDWQRLFMEWVSAHRSHTFSRAVIGALNVLGVDPDVFEAELDERLGDYYRNVRALADAGEPLTPREMRTGVGRVLRGIRGWEGATQTDIREHYLRGRVPYDRLEPHPRGTVSALITRGAGWIAEFMAAGLPKRPAEVEEREVSQLVGVGSRVASEVVARATAGDDWAIFTRALFADHPEAIPVHLRMIIQEHGLEWGDYGTAMHIFEREMREQYARTSSEDRERVLGTRLGEMSPRAQLEAAERNLPHMLEEFGRMRADELARLRGDEDTTPEEVQQIMEGMDTYPQMVIEGITQLRREVEEMDELLRPATTGIPMEYDPKEYLVGMKKVARGMGFKGAEGWKSFVELIRLKSKGKEGEVLQEQAGSLMALVGATLKGREEAGVLSEEQRKSLSEMMAKAPRFWELYQATPHIDPDTGEPEAIGKDRFMEEVRRRIGPEDLVGMGEELRKVVNNPEIRAMLSQKDLTGLHNTAIQMKRVEQATMDLEPAFGGALDYWT